MKKVLIFFSCCVFVVACSNNKSGNKLSDIPNNADSAAGAAVSSTTKQSEVDTSINNIGSSATAGAPASTGESAETYEKGATLIAASDCATCHREDKKLVGPAYKDVAKKYEPTEENLNYLATKIIQGGKGVWGEVPMSPHPNVSEEYAREMAKYILSLK
jgi:cytochrome c